MRNPIIYLSLCMMCVTSAMAGGGTTVNGDKWGAQTPNMYECGQHAIGESDICLGETTGCKAFEHCRYGNRCGLIMMIAKSVNDNGGYFCPIYVDSSNTKNRNTIYHDIAGTTCHWLCRPGYSGANCAEFTSNSAATMCDPDPVRPEKYANLTVPADGTPNIEDSVPMFHWNWYNKCSTGNKNEHDMILAIVGWTPTGHGAFVQPMILRAQKANDRNSIVSYPPRNAKRVLLCKKGYKPNSAGTDCEIINRDVCTESEDDMLAQLCTGFKKDGYDAAQHELTLQNTCYTYSCRKPGHAFTSASDTTCAPCDETQHGGPSPVNGVCIQCPTGKIFNANAASSNYCADTIGLTKLDMLYGRSKTRADVPKLEDQCWPKAATTEEFKGCILGQKQVIKDSKQ